MSNPQLSTPVSPPLSFNLGPSDISKIVDAILPPLSKVLSNQTPEEQSGAFKLLSKLTPEQQYVALFASVSKLALGKTFSNNKELASLVEKIVKEIISKIFSKNTLLANPDSDYCSPANSSFACVCIWEAACYWNGYTCEQFFG